MPGPIGPCSGFFWGVLGVGVLGHRTCACLASLNISCFPPWMAVSVSFPPRHRKDSVSSFFHQDSLSHTLLINCHHDGGTVDFADIEICTSLMTVNLSIGSFTRHPGAPLLELPVHSDCPFFSWVSSPFLSVFLICSSLDPCWC